MRWQLLIVLLPWMVLAGCAQPKAPPAVPVLAVPWAGQGGAGVPSAGLSGLAIGMLQGNEVMVARGPKGVLGPVELDAVSAYREWTYDAQPIGVQPGLGYRYRWVMREGLTVP